MKNDDKKWDVPVPVFQGRDRTHSRAGRPAVTTNVARRLLYSSSSSVLSSALYTHYNGYNTTYDNSTLVDSHRCRSHGRVL